MSYIDIEKKMCKTFIQFSKEKYSSKSYYGKMGFLYCKGQFSTEMGAGHGQSILSVQPKS